MGTALTIRIVHVTCILFFISPANSALQTPFASFVSSQQDGLEEAAKASDEALQLFNQGKYSDAVKPAKRALEIPKFTPTLLGENPVKVQGIITNNFVHR